MENTTYAVADLVPHAGKMSLLTRIVAYADDSLTAEVDIHAESMFIAEQGVPAYIGIEYMAQAVAAYAGRKEKTAGGAPKLGFLLGTRRYKTNVEWFPVGTTLTIHVISEMMAGNGLHVFQATIEAGDISASANLNVFQPDDPNQFLKELTT